MRARRNRRLLVEICTDRLILRPIVPADFDALMEIMNGRHVREVWGHPFSPEDVRQWIAKRRKGYAENGADYLLAVSRETGEPVGQAGLLKEEMDGKPVWGIGWILGEKHEGKGYATESARALAAYAFTVMGLPEICCDIRPENEKSRAVAARLGMEKCGQFVKIYRGAEMPHDIFRLKREDWR